VSLCLLMPSVLSIGGFGELAKYRSNRRVAQFLCNSWAFC